MHWFYQLLIVYFASTVTSGILLVAQGESFAVLGNLVILGALSFHWRDKPWLVLVVSLGIAVLLRPPVMNKRFKWKQSVYTTTAISFMLATVALLQITQFMTPPALRASGPEAEVASSNGP